MAEFDMEDASTDMFQQSFNQKPSQNESADNGNSCRELINKVGGDVISKKESRNCDILENSVVNSEIENDILTQTNTVDNLGEEISHENSVRLNNLENIQKLTESASSSVSTINNIHDKPDDHEEVNHILHNSLANGTTNSVHKSVPKVCEKKKKGVSFPKDTPIAGYFDPPDPWKNAPSWTIDELVSAYKTSCEINGTKPIAKLIIQLQAMDPTNQPEKLLSLKGEKLDQKQCECLEEILKRVQFKLLELEACHLDDECAVALFDMIEYYESACQLNIAVNRNIQARGWQACSKLVRRTPNLTFLDLRNCDLNDRTIPIFGRALKLGCHLTILHMENMNLSGRQLLILVAAIKMNEVLQELFLADNKLMPTDGVQLGNLLHYNHKLSLLDLRNNHLQDVGTSHICEGLAEQNKGSGLRTLVLWNNSINYQAMSMLGRALASSQNLETLNIGHNPITNEGVHLLKDGLLRVNSLLRLGLQGSRISDEGAVALAEYIADTKSLLRIDLRDNDVKTGGLMALSHALRVNTSVTRIDLDKEPKKEPGIKDYIEQQSRLHADILTFQQRNVQIALKREEEERSLLKEKSETEIAATKSETENEQQTRTLPENSSTESFTLIDDVIERDAEDVSEKDAEQETNRTDAEITNAKHQDPILSKKPSNDNDELQRPQHEDVKRPQQRPNALFPCPGLSRQASLDSSVPKSDVDHLAFTISDDFYESTSQPHYASETVNPAHSVSSTPAEMILSPQYFPKQIARKIFSVVRVNEDPSCSRLSTSLPLSYDPLSVSPIPLIPTSSLPSLSPLPTSVSIVQCSEMVPKHSKAAPQVASPSTLLVQDLAKETMRHMLSPDVHVKNLSARNLNHLEHRNSHETVDNIKETDEHKRDLTFKNSSETGVESSSYSEAAAAAVKTHPLSVSHNGIDDCDDLKSSMFEVSESKASAASSGDNCAVDNSEKESTAINHSSVIADRSVLTSEAADFSQQKLLLSSSSPEKAQLPPRQCFSSQELDLQQYTKQVNHKNDVEIKDGNNTFKEFSQADIFTNSASTECHQQSPEMSCDSHFFSIEENPESDSCLSDSKSPVAAFLNLEADVHDSAHRMGSCEKDDILHHHAANGLSEDSKSVFLMNEKHLPSTVADLYGQEEPVSVCLNNFNSPSLLVSEELTSASLQDKSVIRTCDSGDHPFSSIVDLLRLDIDMHDMSDRKDRQMDVVVASEDSSDDLVKVINLVSDNLDIENVDFSMDEEPWLSVGVEIDGNDTETSRKSLKQPDFFTTLSMNGLTQELASALTTLDGSNGPFEVDDYDLDS